MNNKIISTILVAGSSLAALFFVVKQNFELAIFFLTLMFTLTNLFRARTFKEQGYMKESGWMKKMSIFFGICTVLVLIVILT